MHTVRNTALALTVTTLVVAGCGSSGSTTQKSAEAPTTAAHSETPAPVTTLSRSRLITSADAICRRIRAERAKTSSAPSPDVASNASRFAGYQQLQYSELVKLPAPASMSADWKQIVEDNHTMAVGAARIAEYAKANRLGQSGEILSQIGVAEHSVAIIAKRDGFHDCAEVA